jgi:hypothetical protein
MAESSGELTGNAAIEFIGRRGLREVRVDSVAWETEYVDDETGETWILDYPDSGRHGGGAPRMRRAQSPASIGPTDL